MNTLRYKGFIGSVNFSDHYKTPLSVKHVSGIAEIIQ